MAVRTIFATGLFFAFSAIALTSRLAADDQLPWAEDFATACQQANAQGKLVLIHFYSDDCPPCVRVEKNVFSQPEVGAAVGRSCVPVKVHARKTPALVSRYQVQAWPTDVFVTPAGLEIKRSVSPQAATDYISMVNSVAATAGIGAARAQAAGMIAQVSSQASGQANWMTQSAAATAQQYQQQTQQVQQSAQQQAQQQWQQAQAQASQAATQAQQYAQQTAATAQQNTQATADSAKEVINRYSQPLQQASATSFQPPYGGVAPAFVPPGQAVPQEQPMQQQVPQQQVLPQQVATFAPNNAAPSYSTPNYAAPSVSVPAAAPQPQPQAALAPGAYPVAMEGYCPVTLATERKWKKGQPQFGAVHRRRTFLFTSQAEQQKFLAEPDRYSPVMVGYDPVKFMQTGNLVDGRATFSLTYRKQVYLFTDDASLKTFWTNPAQFTEGLRQAMTQTEARTFR